MTQLSVLIASEDSAFRSASARIFRTSGVSVGVTEEPPSADSGSAPDVALIDGRPSGAGWQQVEDVRSRWPAVTILAVASESAPDRILEAMRAGANEFFVWPIGHGGPPDAMEHGVHTALKKTSERLRTASPTERPSSRVSTFLGTKGGVGTTTLAVNCATELARLTKQPTLIVDLNPFIGEVGLFLGVRPRFTVLEALDSVDRLDEVFLKKLVATHKTGLDIIAGSEQLDRPNADDSPRVKQLLRILMQSYPFIVVDAGRLTNASAGTAMCAADATFLVAIPDVASIRNTRRLVDRMRQIVAGTDHVRILLNRMSNNPAFDPDQIEEVIGRPVDHGFPNDHRTVSEALNSGVPLTTTNNTELAAQLGQFTRKLVGMTPGQKTEAPKRPGQLLGLF